MDATLSAAKSSLPRAFVLGDGLNALGVVRSLAAGGVPVLAVANRADALVFRSRHARAHAVLPLEGGACVEGLLALAAQQSRPPALFLTEEKTVRTVSEHREVLQAACRIALPEHGRLMALMHKQGFQALAEASGAPIPRLVHLESEVDLPLLERLTFPCVLKPARKDYAYGARFKKAYVVDSPVRVAELYREIAPVLADIVVQEWIPGEDSDIYFCLQYIGADGRLAGSFAGRKLRSWPPRIGGTASCLPAWDEAAELERLTHDFFRAVGFVGMGSMEYKRDPRDGRFYMIEPTVARTDFQEEVATVNGVNLPHIAYCHEAGLPLPELRPGRPTIWRDAVVDRWSRQEQGGAGGLEAGLAVCDALWRWSDPRPWWGSARARVEGKLRTLLRLAVGS